MTAGESHPTGFEPWSEIHLPSRDAAPIVTRVCLVGRDDVDLHFELLSRETSREALATYDLSESFENAVAVETVSLGAAVALLNDLNWYLVRFADEALILDPSVSETEWLSRDLATAVRNGAVDPDETGEYLKIYGLEDGRLVEPLYVRRTKGEHPEYDLRDVDETVVVRVDPDEFE
ncbi:MAG: hypothetical protein ACI9YT_000505 [Halobacteriales archaeon]